MKKILYFFAGCAAVGFVLSLLIGFFPVFSYVGKGFLVSLEQGQYEQTYNLLSEKYRHRVDFATYKNTIQQSGIDQYESVNWFKTVIDKESERGYLVGVVTTKDNKKVPIEMDFVKEKGQDFLDQGWRLDNLKLGREVITGEQQYEEPHSNH